MDTTDTLIAFVLDRSGSMGPVTSGTIEGFNSFLDEQRKVEGNALVSLALFPGANDFGAVSCDRVLPPTDIDEVGALGSDIDASLFRVAARTHHPDRGGDPEVFRNLTKARDMLLGLGR